MTHEPRSVPARYFCGASTLVLIVFCVVLLAPAPLQADFRWTTGYGQGALVARVTNADGAELEISCHDEGSLTPGATLLTIALPISLQYELDDFVHAQFEVDGIALPMPQEAEIMAEGGFVEVVVDSMEGAERVWFVRLVEALSAGKSVTVTVPAVKAAQFTLRGAAEALEGARDNCGLKRERR